MTTRHINTEGAFWFNVVCNMIAQEWIRDHMASKDAVDLWTYTRSRLEKIFSSCFHADAFADLTIADLEAIGKRYKVSNELHRAIKHARIVASESLTNPHITTDGDQQ